MSDNSNPFVSEDFVLTKQKFDIYYEENVLPELQKIERTRRKYLRIFLLLFVVVGIWLFFAVTNIGGETMAGQKDDGGIKGLAGCALVLLLCWPMFSYYRRGKESLLPLLAGFFGDFKYEYHGNVPQDILQDSKLFKSTGLTKAEDCFHGSFDNVPVSITEYNVYEIYRQKSKDSGRIEQKPVKSGGGIIFYAQMNKNFTGQTIVVKDKGWLNKLTRYENMQRVGVEFPDFEKSYEVYSDNQIEARYILTTAMLGYMTELKNIFHKLEFSFFKQHMLINITTTKNLFECNSFFRSVINKKRIDKNFTELYLLFSIIRTLRLNQKSML